VACCSFHASPLQARATNTGRVLHKVSRSFHSLSTGFSLSAWLSFTRDVLVDFRHMLNIARRDTKWQSRCKLSAWEVGGTTELSLNDVSYEGASCGTSHANVESSRTVRR
jgi:hypothetical protein